MSHTPGPWHVRTNAAVRPGGSITIEHDLTSGTRLIVAEVWTADDAWAGAATQEPISIANARLIAACPTMKTALEQLVLHANDTCDCGRSYSEIARNGLANAEER